MKADGDKMQKILSLCAIMLRGSTKTSAKSLLHHVQLAAAKVFCYSSDRMVGLDNGLKRFLFLNY
jgi:hypothetical protein